MKSNNIEYKCPKCGQKFQDWVETCPDCNVLLIQKQKPKKILFISALITLVILIAGGLALTIILSLQPSNSSKSDNVSVVMGQVTFTAGPAVLETIPIPITISIDDMAVNYRDSLQNLYLLATITTSNGKLLNTGTVIFTIKNQNDAVIDFPVSTQVNNGIAQAWYPLSGGATAGQYFIQAEYTYDIKHIPVYQTGILTIK